MKKLTFENIVIIFPDADQKEMFEAWNRLQKYMGVYFTNHRKSKEPEVKVNEVDNNSHEN